MAYLGTKKQILKKKLTRLFDRYWAIRSPPYPRQSETFFSKCAIIPLSVQSHSPEWAKRTSENGGSPPSVAAVLGETNEVDSCRSMHPQGDLVVYRSELGEAFRAESPRHTQYSYRTHALGGVHPYVCFGSRPFEELSIRNPKTGFERK